MSRLILLVTFLAAFVFAPITQANLGPSALAGLNAHKDDFQLSRWVENVAAAGGTLSTNDVNIARGVIEALNRSSYRDKVVYMLAMLGQNVAATRVPILNRLAVTATATNTGFVDADFSDSTGLKGNGSSKIFTLAMKPSELGSGNNGGMGFWENDIDFTGTASEVCGIHDATNTQRFVLDLRSSRKFFCWGNPSNVADPGTGASNGHYYGQRSSATLRELYINGALVASNTTSDTASGAAAFAITVMGCNQAGVTTTYWKGRCAVFYLTDGTLSSTEVADLHTLLNTYLITPMGR